MSTVINKAKHQYRNALVMEACLLSVLGFMIMITKGQMMAVSFFMGGIAGFFPFCLFVYWVFFRNSAKDRTKMTAFYWGEAIKWLMTITMIAVSFLFIPKLQYLVFFVGYFLALFSNIALPILLSRKSTT